jgi:hypothetical protein
VVMVGYPHRPDYDVVAQGDQDLSS